MSAQEERMEKTEEKGQVVAGLRTLERGLDILDLYGQEALKLSLSEIAEKINLTPSTTSRLLHTLNLRGYVSRDEETKKFSIGPQALRFSVSSLRTFDLRKIAAPFLQSLHQKYNESVSLYILLDGHRVCIDRLETTHALRHVVNVGDRLPLPRGAGGKVLLAWLAEEERKKIPAADAVPASELEKIRKQGYSISLGERDQGVSAIAAPIFDVSGRILCALAVAGPIVRLSPEVLAAMAPNVVDTARKVSAALGHA
jgi:DNA-binding IclR family transcriptional regulator